MTVTEKVINEWMTGSLKKLDIILDCIEEWVYKPHDVIKALKLKENIWEKQ